MKSKIKRAMLFVALCLASCSAILPAQEQVAKKLAETPAPAPMLAATPPMGWNSFDSYGVYLHEKAAMENVEAMAARFKQHGYTYFVIDNGWFSEYRLRPGTMYSAEKHARDVRLNEFGHFMPSKCYFPNGLKPIADRCHALGLKFGVHLMRGIPRKAYTLNLPIKGTKYRAQDIANTSKKENCTWCTYNYAVDMSKPGAQEWYDGLIQHIADMGVDMIKYDDIVPHPDEVEAIAKAIKKCGRPILLSLSPGNKAPQTPEAVKSFQMGNMLRVTGDIWDNQKGIDHCFDAWRKWAGYSKPGFWVDMDMIPFGKLQIMSPVPEKSKTPEKSKASKKSKVSKKSKASKKTKTSKKSKGNEETVLLAGKGNVRWSELTKPQHITFITMRALSASPLMIGGDLPTMDEFSFSLLTDKEMIACNQNGVMGTLKYEQAGVETWVTPKKGSKTAG
ncbi:MAG: glycoside hydrolase family 27 protein, partial [Phycisphaerales bacterium]|nr:glycoside hydrolase family 27 protein [Phycisphaerales bacterium]